MIYTSGTTGHPKGALRTGSDPETVVALLAGPAASGRARRCTSPPDRSITRVR